MGRGGNNYSLATTASARDLLYGRNLRGRGPQAQLLAEAKDWHSFQINLVDHLAAVGYVDCDVSGSNYHLVSDEEDGPVRHVLFELPHKRDNNITRIITIDEQGRRGIRLAILNNGLGAGTYCHQLPVGSQASDDLDMLEDYLYDNCEDLGIDFVEQTFSWRQISRRFTDDDSYELAFNSWEEINSGELIRDRLIDIIDRYHQRDGYNHKDLVELKMQVINVDDQDSGQYLEALRASEVGQRIIEDRDQWRLRRLVGN